MSKKDVLEENTKRLLLQNAELCEKIQRTRWEIYVANKVAEPKKELLNSYIKETNENGKQLRLIGVNREIIDKITEEIFRQRSQGLTFSSDLWMMKSGMGSVFFNESLRFLASYGFSFDESRYQLHYPTKLVEHKNKDEIVSQFSTNKVFWDIFDEKLKMAYEASELAYQASKIIESKGNLQPASSLLRSKL